MRYNTAMTTDQLITFFREAHDSINHKRKYTGFPYWTHTEEVLEILQSFGYYGDDFTIGALGHDVLEDVAPINADYSFEKLVEKFGRINASVILDLTDVFTKTNFPAWNRKARKESEAWRLVSLGNTPLIIKLADLISNTRDITENDPKFAKTYIKEKKFLLTLIEYRRFDTTVSVSPIFKKAKALTDHLWLSSQIKSN